MRISKDSITRIAADTTQYSLGDVITNTVASVLRFATNNSSGSINSAILVDSVIAGGTKLQADLLLYSAAPTIAADNAAFSPTAAQETNLVAVVPFLTANFVGAVTAGHTVSVLTAPIPFVAPDGVLYGVLVARSTYTPTGAEVITINLGIV
jgi:hypothetical protein